MTRPSGDCTDCHSWGSDTGCLEQSRVTSRTYLSSIKLSMPFFLFQVALAMRDANVFDERLRFLRLAMFGFVSTPL